MPASAVARCFASLPALVAAVGLGLAALPAAAVRDDSDRAPHWRTLGRFGVSDALPRALARSRDGRDVAVGDADGVRWWSADRRERAALSDVRDVAFDAAGVLWIASGSGLFRWTPSGRPERRPLGRGGAADAVHRIVADGEALLLATDAGAWWSSDGRIFQRLPSGGAALAVSRVALRPRASGPLRDPGATGDADAAADPASSSAERRLWIYGPTGLLRVRGIERATGLRVIDVERLDPPRPGDRLEVVDLRVGPAGRRLFVVYTDQIAWRWTSGAAPPATEQRWHVERPGLPPGARIQRLGWAAGRVWLATDHGLLEAASWTGPFRRVASPLGTSACLDVQSRGVDGAVALCRAGLFALEAPDPSAPDAAPLLGRATASRASGGSPIPPDPPVGELRRRALERAGLAPRRMARLWKGLRRRALWPDLSLQLGYDADHGRAWDYDQAFTSGDTRHLYDRTRDDDEHYEASVSFDWELGGLAYPDDSVDLSREMRQVVSLRDDVVDEVHQIYFERQEIRERLAAVAPDDPAERARLMRRARELDADLDAWTGGWLSEWRRSRRADSREVPDTP